MNKFSIALLAALGSTLAAFGGPEEEHFDVWVRIVDGDLVTGSITEDGTPLESTWRIFSAEFGEEPQFPFTADEPGFQLDDGSVEPGTAFTFLMGPVRAWTGAGYGPTSATVTMDFGPQSTTSRSTMVAGFNFAADGLGGFHDHFEITVNGLAGDPEDGIYLIPLQLAGLAGSFGATPTFWFVMNLDRPEKEHEAAIEWAVEQLTGAPARCDADTNGDGTVDVGDLIGVIESWGVTGCP